MSNELKGKTVIVTGAASGLGECLATDLAKLGAKLVLADLNQSHLEEVADRLARQAEVVAVPTDVTDSSRCVELIATSVERFGSIDALVLCAGISMWARFEDIGDVSAFGRIMEINYLGVVNCLHPALPYLKTSRGILVTISSTQGVIGLPNHTGYSASKHAINGFLEALELELGDELRILNVLPGWIKGTNLRANAITGDGTVQGSRKKHSKDAVTVEDSSEQIVQAMLAGRRELYLPSKLRFVPWVKLIAPGWLKSKIRRAVEEQDRT